MPPTTVNQTPTGGRTRGLIQDCCFWSVAGIPTLATGGSGAALRTAYHSFAFCTSSYRHRLVRLLNGRKLNGLDSSVFFPLNFSGIKINGNLFASSSHDGFVCLWTLDGNRITIIYEPNHLLKCIGFSGNTVFYFLSKIELNFLKIIFL